ncbi:endonuclease/exonuclease/phosphatase family protein [Mucilaginibacter auburnensis]|uniref:Endonuclease/exonuclease/phosphatase (EEP) superfamily protein YafD n=1 Tax=Mucilaginibacter auburnensis TaxID=1457233 RepID=A0A2H9VWA1_9SPHI|nr:endonuclease/exonuclease/phosphatase family protein [Mucilaginibacter auburnensis]PJJ85081.1 endonuclease/exonuclease/phosphatase (EEP) superfamily protein YafD [Mucilaginibacter auburnensis]
MNTIIVVLTCMLLCFSILPLIRNDYWVFRVFDYPRLQKLFLSTLVFLLLFVYYDGSSIWLYTLAGLLLVNICYLLWLIWPFTILSAKQVLKATDRNPANRLSIMIANIFQDNKNSRGCLTQIARVNPDILVLLETNSRWDLETRELEYNYPYHCRVPLENTYGLLLYSKLELTDTHVEYLVEEEIPSIHTKVTLRNGKQVQLFAVHPTPPTPNENVRSTERDKELLLIADLAHESELPVIVAGDLNDVAWSHTTELFLKMSGLLDPRRGRGFFNSFHANYFFVRFPLDHAFISPHFKLNAIKRLRNCGSDHFPIYLSVQLDETAVYEQQPLAVDADDIEEAEEKKEKI